MLKLKPLRKIFRGVTYKIPVQNVGAIQFTVSSVPDAFITFDIDLYHNHITCSSTKNIKVRTLNPRT